MENRITATNAVRDFSELLNRIKFKGEHYIIERNGSAIAQMSPMDEEKNIKTLKLLSNIIDQLPPLDDDIDSFAADLENLYKNQPTMPEDGIWE